MGFNDHMKKVFNIISPQENANLNYKIQLHTHCNGCNLKDKDEENLNLKIFWEYKMVQPFWKTVCQFP